ncbi:hypothetical protein ACQQ2N_12095 [Dokdonella sp. MW10]|uniref:hypothetical protein n=1 Tax=Dokdonella sp. MW10 TaxID=2992926 RepID=UPI003F7FC29E
MNDSISGAPSFLSCVASKLGEQSVTRDVEVEGGTSIKIRFRKLTAGAAEKLFNDGGPAKKGKSLRARLIAATVSFPSEDGDVDCSEADANALPNDFANSLQNIALEVNGIVVGGEKKDSED